MSLKSAGLMLDFKHVDGDPAESLVFNAGSNKQGRLAFFSP